MTDAVDPLIGRHLFAACLGLTWTRAVFLIGAPGDLPYTRGTDLRALQRARIPALLGLTAIYLPILELWALGRAELLTGVAVLGLLAAIRQWEKSLWSGDIVVSLGKYAPAAAALLGYTVARTLTADPEPDRAGWEGAIGVLGAIFTLNGATKWQQGGLRWFAASGLGLLVAERAHDGPPLLRRARRWLASSPRWCVVLSGGTAILETLGILLWIPALRAPLAVVLVCVLLGFYVFLGYFELEWMLLVTSLALNAR